MEQFGLGVDIEWAERPGIYHPWIANLGDWGGDTAITSMAGAYRRVSGSACSGRRRSARSGSR